MDLTELRAVEAIPYDELKQFVEQVIATAIEHTGAALAIVDCHGSRDALSYAAAAASDHALVVSVPDQITFFGTISFAKDLKEHVGRENDPPKVHLIFNRVQRGFGRRTISSWYRRFFRRYFDDDDFLSLIPEDRSTSSDNCPGFFPTGKRVYSMLANKMRVIVVNLFGEQEGVTVSKEARFVSRLIGPFIRSRTPAFSVLLGEFLPIRLLVGSLIVMMIVMVGALELAKILDGSVNWLVSHLGQFFLGIATVVTVGMVAFIWTACAIVTRSIVEHDGIGFSDSVRGGIRGFAEGLYRVVIVLLSVVFLAFISVDSAPTVAALEVLIAALTADNDIQKSTMEFMYVFIAGMRLTEVIGKLLLASFIIVFAVRSVRMLLFRLRSIECAYRVLVFTGAVGCWHWLQI